MIKGNGFEMRSNKELELEQLIRWSKQQEINSKKELAKDLMRLTPLYVWFALATLNIIKRRNYYFDGWKIKNWW